MVLSKLIGREKKRLPKEWLSIRVSQNHTAIYIYIYIYIYTVYVQWFGREITKCTEVMHSAYIGGSGQPCYQYTRRYARRGHFWTHVQSPPSATFLPPTFCYVLTTHHLLRPYHPPSATFLPHHLLRSYHTICYVLTTHHLLRPYHPPSATSLPHHLLRSYHTICYILTTPSATFVPFASTIAPPSACCSSFSSFLAVLDAVGSFLGCPFRCFFLAPPCSNSSVSAKRNEIGRAHV